MIRPLACTLLLVALALPARADDSDASRPRSELQARSESEAFRERALAGAQRPLSSANPLVELRWGQVQGLMAGITVAHAVQPIAAAFGDIAWKDKYYVSIGGGVLYGTTLVGLLLRQEWALYVSLVGPAVGLTSVLGGWALDAAGVIDATVRPDVFQVVGGLLQVAAWIVAYQLLEIDPRF